MKLKTPCSLKKFACLYGLALTAILISIHFLDRNIAELLHEQGFSNRFLTLLSQSPILLETLVLLSVIGCLSRYWRKIHGLMTINLIATLALASLIRVGAKRLFGRTWPETWIDNNPSWIKDGIDAFHPFAEGIAYNSFPSGHALFTFALATVFWYHSPQLRYIWVTTLIAVFIGQLGQNYHYLGDLLAGATLGTLTAQIVILASDRFSTRDRT